MDEQRISAIQDQIGQEIMDGRFVTDLEEDGLSGPISYWRIEIGHPPSGHGYCRTCGPATSCLLMIYLDAAIETAVRRAIALSA